MSAVATVSPMERVRADIDAYLAGYYRERVARAGALHEDYAVLWRAMEDLGASGGKRVRPYVMLTAYRGLGGDGYRRVLPVAAALELLHTSMLIHDDIIDRDYVRYGRLNIAGQYRERYAPEMLDDGQRAHYANAAALLAGDLALSGAYEMILGADLPDDLKVMAASLLHESVFMVAGGELLDTEAVLLPFAGVDTEVIAQLKTSAYSFVYPLLMAATLAGAAPRSRQALETMGNALGIAYQLADDILGLFGDEAVTGKTARGDLQEGKRTYLMQQTFALASPAARAELERLVGRGRVTSAEAAAVRTIVRDCGALAQSRRLMNRYTAEARAALARAGLQPDVATELLALIHTATARQR